VNHPYPEHKNSAIEGCRLFFQAPCLILDTETTGLGEDAEICELAIIDLRGVVLFNQRIKPVKPIPAEASAIHGIKNEDVAECKDIKSFLPEIKFILGPNIYVLAYNCDYDWRLFQQSFNAAGLQSQQLGKKWICAMKLYAEFIGQLGSSGRRYKWQKLPALGPGPAHSALGDCLSTLELLKMMANTETSKEEIK
jgi:DNA polymerase III epsilon subunit-like protein